MNLFDFLMKKQTINNNPIDFKPLVKDPLADSTGYRADGSMAHSQELPLVQINNDNTATTQQWQEHKKPTFGQRVGEMLFGKQAQATDSVNTENPLFNMITAKTDDWKKQGISDEAIQGVAQGLNSGNKELAQFITDNKINTPKTAEEIALAKEGKFNDYTPVASTISENPRVGGALRDIAGGYNENLNNAISLNNFGQNETPDGRKKGFAYRLGEGLGSISRFAQSPLGRGLIVGGLVGATGGDALPMLAYGAGTTMQNQANRMNDKLYRNELKQTYQQSIMNDPRYNTLTSAEDKQIQDYIKQSPEYLNAKTDEEKATIAGNMYNSLASEKIASKQNEALQEVYANIDGLRGYVDKNAFGSMVQAQQLRDNAGYRNMMLSNQQRQNEIMNAMRKEQLQAQEEQQKFNRWYQKASLEDKRADRAERRAYNNAQLGLGYARLNLDEYKATHPTPKSLSDKQVSDIASIDESLSEMRNIINTYQNPKYKSYFGISGFAKRNPITGKFDPVVSQMSQDIELFRKTVAKAKEGGRLTDQDQRYYEKALLNPNLTQKQFLELAKRFETQMSQKRKILLNNYAKQGKDVTNFIENKTSGTPQTYKSGKYTVRVK
nr:MAG TPA: hypothetical protein [Caudoviricetes sp.]